MHFNVLWVEGELTALCNIHFEGRCLSVARAALLLEHPPHNNFIDLNNFPLAASIFWSLAS